MLVTGNTEELHLGEVFEKLGMKKDVEDGRNKEHTSKKMAKRGARSAALGKRRGRRNMVGGTSTTAESSQRQQVLLAEEDLLEVSIHRDDGWNYVAGSTQEEVEDEETREACSKTCGGSGWPETATS